MDLVHTLTKLISFQTVTGSQKETQALCRWVKDELQPVPVYVREYNYNDLPSLVITPTRRKHARLWLAAHTDVVAADPEMFRARREGDRLIGRGAIDMKFAIACYVNILKELAVRVKEYDIGVMLTPDEEWGKESSVKFLLEKEGYTGDVVFLPDGYGSWKFEESAKGIWGLSVETTGIAAHGSKPWHGHSAVAELVAFLAEAQRRVDEVCTKRDDEAHWYSTMNIGQIDGGAAFNIVAAHARATVDIRYTTKSDRAKIERIFRDLHAQFPNTVYTVTHDVPPYGILRKNGYVQCFANIAAEHGVECGWMKSHGSSDARFFNSARIPTILIGPEGGESHGDGEWIDIPDLTRYYAVLRDFVEAVARK